MSGIVRRYWLRKKEKKLFLDRISGTLEINPEKMFGSKPQVEVVETSRHRVFVVNGEPVAAGIDDDLSPTLFFKEYFPLLPKAIVDMGAVQHVCSGADVMAPGVVEIKGDFKEKDLVVILDERNRKPIAIARSLLDSETSKTTKKGKTFINLIYVGDDVWNAFKTSEQKRKG